MLNLGIVWERRMCGNLAGWEREKFPKRRKFWACAQARGWKSKTYSVNSRKLAQLKSRLHRCSDSKGWGWLGRSDQPWGSEVFMGKVMRTRLWSLGTTRLNLDLMLVAMRKHDHIFDWKYLASILEDSLASCGIIVFIWTFFCKDYLRRVRPRVNGYRLRSVDATWFFVCWS